MKGYIAQQKSEMLNLLKQLVNIDSGTYVKKGVDHVGDVLRKEYEQLGFSVEVDEQETLGHHLVIRHPEAIAPQIILIAHLDTVFPKGTVSKRPFSIEGDYAYGPGVIDMKASHVTTLYALKALIDHGSDAFKNVVLLLNSDEEIGSISSRPLIEKIAKDIQYALILEPSQKGNLVSERKGGGKYFLQVTGKAAHAGANPEDGASAILELAQKVTALHALAKPEEGLYVNVGLISGGTSINTIAPFAEAAIDVRIDTKEQGIAIDEAIKKVTSKAVDPDVQLTLTGKITRPAWQLTEGSKQLINQVIEQGEQLGLTLTHGKSGGGSDGNLTGHIGIPTVDGLGPIGGNAHAASEFLYIPSLTERSLLLANVVKQLSVRH